VICDPPFFNTCDFQLHVTGSHEYNASDERGIAVIFQLHAMDSL